MKDVIEQLASGRQLHIDRLVEWLRIPSVSTDPQRKGDVRDAGEWIQQELARSGFAARLDETDGHPVCFASWNGAEGAPTVLIYGHYDVQPPEPLELWRHGAFEPTVEDDNLIARGATDDKGQVLALVRGICGVLQQRGSLPVNIKFLIEGEEEIGSPNLAPYIEAHKEELTADVAVISDCSQFAPGIPAITVALKGLVYLEIFVQGPNRDLHSGSFGGAVENPANVLTRILGSLRDEAGRITIPGFYENVRDLTPEERADFASLPFDEDGFRDDLEVPQVHGEAGWTTLERKGARPTLDINGLLSGWTGEGAKTVLPAHASAKLSMRLVPDQDPDVIDALVSDHLRSLCPPSCTIEVRSHHGAHPVLVERNSHWLDAAARAVEKGFGKAPVYIREGGSIPVVSDLKRILGIDTILLGLGLPDDNAHSPNEKFHLPDYQRGIETAAWFLDEISP